MSGASGESSPGGSPISGASAPADQATPGRRQKRAPRPVVPAPWWLRAVPFFMSAFLFLSGVFALFSPLPILLLGLRSRRVWAWVGAATNTGLVFVLGGSQSVAVYAVLILTIGLAFPEFLRARKRIESAASWTLLLIGLAFALVVATYAQVHHVSPAAEVRSWVSNSVDLLDSTLTPDAKESLFEGAAPADVKKTALVQLPWVLGFVSLVLVWVNVLTVFRINPNRLRERLGIDAAYFRRWKTPEWLVWPTIVTGALVLWGDGVVSDTAMNGFRFLMAIYALQGLSILSFLFDLWSVRGFIRSVGYLVALFLMMPLLLSMGFFDLWFDFRGKLRQSS